MDDVKARSAPSYAGDFYAWSQDQGRRLREARPNSLDWENLAEEIERLGRSEKGELENRLNILVLHLLKWQYQPAGRKPGWRATILEQRNRIARRIAESPSLAGYPASVLPEEYETARLKAAGETRLSVKRFPEDCPFTPEQILDPEFWPDVPRE
jgi:hypothetical protein